MNHRNSGHKIDWRDAWQHMRKERKRKVKVSFDKKFSKKAGEDFSKRIKSNAYEYGRKSTALLGNIITGESTVLEIGTGPGTVTIPLSKKVGKIVGIELSEKQICRLKNNLHEEHRDNVQIINNSWEQVINDNEPHTFDLVICSHFLWQVADLEKLLSAMEKASKGYCAIIQPCGRDDMVGKIFEKITDRPYAGQFDPDADYFPYVILRERGILVNVAAFHYTFERKLEEQIRYVANFIGRFLEIDSGVEQQIRYDLLEFSNNGCFKEENKAVVMWWQV